MTRKTITPHLVNDPRRVATLHDGSFKELEHHCRATIKEFDRERMGIAAKE